MTKETLYAAMDLNADINSMEALIKEANENGQPITLATKRGKVFEMTNQFSIELSEEIVALLERKIAELKAELEEL